MVDLVHFCELAEEPLHNIALARTFPLPSSEGSLEAISSPMASMGEEQALSLEREVVAAAHILLSLECDLTQGPLSCLDQVEEVGFSSLLGEEVADTSLEANSLQSHVLP